MNIDFVIIWVDGNDKNWIKEKEKYSPNKNTDSRKNRYRDLENLEYWFRGIEKFTPWVRKIHFVTWGHLPKWLNVNHPKLNIVKHSDYISSDYLPTFNSHTIELNIHKIKGLSEKFVYFNDDTFIINNMNKLDFFRENLPCDNAVLDANSSVELFSNVLFNNMGVINNNFDKQDVIKKNFKKWINPKYGKQLYRTLALLPWSKFTGIKNPHLPISFKKNTFNELWNKEYSILNTTCLNKYRSSSDVNVYLLRYWQLLKGDFYPSKISIGKYHTIRKFSDLEEVKKNFLNPNIKMICLNDSIEEKDFKEVKKQLIIYFEKILPNKSSYEI